MRLLVCGGRDYHDREYVFAVLDKVHTERPVELLIHGGARGADQLAADWAVSHDIPILRFPADWARLGKAAGAIRNQRMVNEGRPDMLVSFPGGNGTADMTRRARAANLPVVRA